MAKEPAYVDSVFLSAEGDVVADIPKSVEIAEKSLSELSDDEMNSLYNKIYFYFIVPQCTG